MSELTALTFKTGRRQLSGSLFVSEDGEAVAASRRTAGTKKQREEAVLRDILPQRGGRWAELLAWTAKAAQDEVEGEEWIGFALVARELSGDRPLTEIPLANWIAKNTFSGGR